ncbi:MEKHLA domain-containing protein [Candidatus Nitronereus thalassa]|uniref:MEKHLA domain-containing protein n=1 Tax=Candidatus Nitronereus thalassa TaxID=3020898 RepID=A0ABU3KA49_9BACT|nr:MEKHLA domain-containing protein [Candidatus Nitronereus thalassa]MDT7043301.1 MEKHLA domain-containing protein [Candidatus Nitronereus thalassa]
MKLNTDNIAPPWLGNDILPWIGLLLDSYVHWTGKELLDRQGTLLDQAHRLFDAPFVVASHGNEFDPILNYGNAQALKLWEMDWPEFVATPSRLTAEPMNRVERSRMLQEAGTHGVIHNYQGVRISKTGRRFLVEQATVWNVIDLHQHKVGQAATFSKWTTMSTG